MATSPSVVEFQIISSQTNHNLDLFNQKMEKEDKGLSGVGWSNFFDVRQLGQIYIKTSERLFSGWLSESSVQ